MDLNISDPRNDSSVVWVGSEEYGSDSLYVMLNRTYPDFLCSVPDHWLRQAKPASATRLVVSIIFLCFAVPGNVSQILVILAYIRYNCSCSRC